MRRSSGYVRDADDRPHPMAVRWWYVEPMDGGVFARGGRVPSSRVARREIDNARHDADVERKRIAALRRPTKILERDGSLTDIPRTGSRSAGAWLHQRDAGELGPEETFEMWQRRSGQIPGSLA